MNIHKDKIHNLMQRHPAALRSRSEPRDKAENYLKNTQELHFDGLHGVLLNLYSYYRSLLARLSTVLEMVDIVILIY